MSIKLCRKILTAGLMTNHEAPASKPKVYAQLCETPAFPNHCCMNTITIVLPVAPKNLNTFRIIVQDSNEDTYLGVVG